MPITLAQAKVGMTNKVDQQVIDELRRNSLLLDALIFDNAVSPGTGGSTLGYSYIRLDTPASAAGRRINEEYIPQHAIRKQFTEYLKIMGGNFEIDRVIAATSGAVDEVAFQIGQKAKATANRFNYLFINGDPTGADDTQFNGLNKLISGTDSEVDASDLDLSGEITTAKALTVTETLDLAILSMSARPQFLLANRQTLVKLMSVAKKLGYLTQSEDAFGRPVFHYNGITFLNMESYYEVAADGKTTTGKEIIPVAADGTTDIYFVNLALDGLHGVSPAGDKMITARLPDFSVPQVVHKGDVEFVAAIVLKNTRAAVRLKGVKIK